MSRKSWTDDKLIFRALNNQTENARWENIRVLRNRPGKDLLAKCIKLIHSKDRKSRITGINILAQFGPSPRPYLKETLKEFFIQLDKEKDPLVIGSLLIAIGHNNNKITSEHIGKLCSLADTNNREIKEGLISAIGFSRHLRAVEVLIKLSADKSNDIRNWATFYIGQGDFNNKKVREALWCRVHDKHQETRLEAIIGLAKRKDKRILEIIKQELTSGEHGSLLFEAIITTGDRQFLPLLQKSLKGAKSQSDINHDWLKRLKECITELRRVPLDQTETTSEV